MTIETLNSLATVGEDALTLATSLFLIARVALRIWPNSQDSDLLAFGEQLLSEVALVNKRKAAPVELVQTPTVPVLAAQEPKPQVQTTPQPNP